MPNDVQTGMNAAEMKQLLVKSKKEPVNFAFAPARDPGVALLLLDRTRSGRTLERELAKQFPDAHNARFGTASVDVEDNPQLVKFAVNKPVSGMAKKLVRTLKGTGFNKIEIVLDDGTPVEGFAEEEPADPGGPDPEALKAALTKLIPQIQQITDPERRAGLVKLATMANVNLKMNNAVYAATNVEQLRRALAEPQAATAAAPGPDAEKVRATLAQVMRRIPEYAAQAGQQQAGQQQAWRARAAAATAALEAGNLPDAIRLVTALGQEMTGQAPTRPAAAGRAPGRLDTKRLQTALVTFQTALTEVANGLARLEGKLRATQEPTFVRIAEFGLGGLTRGMRTKLMAAVINLTTAAPDQGGPAAKAARSACADFTALVAKDELLALVDQNPFGVPLACRTALGAALTALEREIAASVA